MLLSEIQHREPGEPVAAARRRPCDGRILAAGDLDDLERRLRKGLRVTDAISRGADGLRVLLVGCDETGAAAALRRAQVSAGQATPGHHHRDLCGTGEGDPA